MNEIVLDGLFPLQKELDEEIHALHGVSYQTTKSRRLMLDEYADGLHFYLSLGLILGVAHLSYSPIELGDKTEAILRAYEKAVALHSKFDEKTYVEGFQSFLDLYPLFGFTAEEVKKAYQAKLSVNHKRQEEKY